MNKVKFIGILSDKYTDPIEWCEILKRKQKAKWCISSTAGEVHTPKFGDIIAVRKGRGNNAKIIFYVEVVSNQILNDKEIKENSDIHKREARKKGNTHIEVSLFKNLNTPFSPNDNFISKDLKHPSKPGIMKRQTTFKPINKQENNKNTLLL